MTGKQLHRHYIAVLIQANRYRRDDHVPSAYRMPNPTELGKAIDYAIRELKTTQTRVWAELVPPNWGESKN